MIEFDKPAMPALQLVEQMISRGLIIEDVNQAKSYIETIGYYRLSAYFIPYYKTQNIFISGTTFNDILGLYIFDRKLRLFSLDPIQRIEIGIRTTISNHMSIKYGPFWFLDKNLFISQQEYNNFYRIASSHIGKGCKHLPISCKKYYEKYGDHELPPSWILAEELPMGCWSKIFANISCNQDKRSIASIFKFKWRDFESWIKSATVIRNSLAHHSRFWNNILSLIPINIDKNISKAGIIDGPYRSFVIIYRLLKPIVQNSSWPQKLYTHLTSCPLSVEKHMCFPKDWHKMPFWQ